MLVQKLNITNFIPQRDPFIMIDTLESANSERFKSFFEVTPLNIFLDGKTLSESALIENIAQTCAAGFGFVNSQNGEQAGGLGFIGAVSKLEVFSEAYLSDIIETSVEIISSFDNIHLIEGIAQRAGEILIKCQMKIVIA